MDRILIKDLFARCVIGIGNDERKDKQDVIINIILSGDYHKAGLSDNIEDAVDYSVIKKRVLSEVEASQFHLVEALAEKIASICLEHPGVISADVTVEKPSALRFARSVGVQIIRNRE
ncbi:MAG: dihydroneopterin aldolase [Armatimonadota bacterium]